MTATAVIFDLGGVVFPSPFEAFDIYDTRAALPIGTTRSIIRTSSEGGAWAALERGELTTAAFHAALEAEAQARGHIISAPTVMSTIAEFSFARVEMVEAIHRLRAGGFKIGALTNNWADERGTSSSTGASAMTLFDVVVESARVGLRKPDPRIYELACVQLGVTPSECVFLDDLGINLKPARSLGMATIKVVDHLEALRSLSILTGIDLV